MLRDFPKHLSIPSILSSLRYVSCRARIAILFFCSVLFILVHLSIRLRFAVGAHTLFMFSMVMFIFAFFFVARVSLVTDG